MGNINSFHGRLKIWKSIFAAGFAIDNYSFLAAFGLNRLDTLSMVFQVLSFKRTVLRWLIYLLSRVVCHVNIGDLQSENGESVYQVFTEELQVGLHSLLAHLSPVWKELWMERDPDQRNF